MDKIIQTSLGDVKEVKVFLRGSGNPNDAHDIVGVKWVTKDGIEQGIGECYHPVIDTEEEF